MPRQVAKQAVHREEGTASVELIAVLPFLLLAILVAAQIAIAGQALWEASVAARAGARAALIEGDAGVVSSRVRVPRLLPGLPRMTVGAKTSLEPDG